MKWNTLFADITPVDTIDADGLSPLVVIAVSDHFRLVHGLLYSIINLDERSERAFSLTSEVIKQNSANYTAWWHRRRCIEALGFESVFESEIYFSSEWIQSSPKNYQVWFHRRWLIEKYSTQSGYSVESKRELIHSEFSFLLQALSTDAKNYNCFSHRVFLLEVLISLSPSESLEDRIREELSFTDVLLERDIRNNSAWSYRRQVLDRLTGGIPFDLVSDEVVFVCKKILMAPHNESGWLYLRSLPGWQAFPHVRELCFDDVNRFATETLYDLGLYHNDEIQVKQSLDLLANEADSLRVRFWSSAVV